MLIGIVNVIAEKQPLLAAMLYELVVFCLVVVWFLEKKKKYLLF
jgi:hypothetical protein